MKQLLITGLPRPNKWNGVLDSSVCSLVACRLVLGATQKKVIYIKK
jgi:hypothetical protein